MKKLLSILLSVCLLLSFSGTALGASAGGSTPANQRAGGLAVSDGASVYYAGFDGIYLASPTGGTGTRLVSPAELGYPGYNYNDGTYHGFSHLDVSDNKLYFYFESDWGHKQYSGIYRYDVQSKTVKKLYGVEYVYYLDAENGKVTFCAISNQNNSTLTFYEMNADGTGDRPLGASFRGDQVSFIVSGSWVYYVDTLDSKGLRPLYRMKLDGTGKTNLNSGYVYSSAGSLVADGDWIYYYQKSVENIKGTTVIGGDNKVNGFYKMKADGSGKTKIGANFYQADNLNLNGGRLYGTQWTTQNDNKQGLITGEITTLSSFNLSGGDQKALVKSDSFTGIESVNAVSGWVYFIAGQYVDGFKPKMDDSESSRERKWTLYRVRSDGTGLQALSTRRYDKSPYAGETYTIEVPL